MDALGRCFGHYCSEFYRQLRIVSGQSSWYRTPARETWHLGIIDFLYTLVQHVSLCGLVAQLVRALPCHGRGRGFESRRVRHIYKNKPQFY